jgi:hypothetical protein
MDVRTDGRTDGRQPAALTAAVVIVVVVVVVVVGDYLLLLRVQPFLHPPSSTATSPLLTLPR